MRLAKQFIVCGFFTIALMLASVSAQTKRGITETDLFKFNWIADPQISPDGARVVFTKVWVNQKADRYDTALWVVSIKGGDARQLTAGPRDASPRWSPDGKTLAFIRSAEKEGKPQPPQIFLLSLDGGEAQPITDLPRGAGAFEWSPDGKTIAFTSSDDGKLTTESGEKPERVSDVRVINKATYRSNGPGYLNPKVHSHIWTIAVASGSKPKQLTKGNWDESAVQWSPDGTRLYFASRRVAEAYYEQPRSDVYSIDLNGGDEKKVLSFEGGMRGFEFSHDGKRIAFGGSLSTVPVLSYKQPDLFVSDWTTTKNLTEGFDFDIGGGIGGDQSAPRGGGGSSAIWSSDDKTLIVNVAEQGRANLKRIDVATGKVTPLTSGDHAIQSFSATPDASKLAVLISSSVNVHDLFLLDAATGKLTQLTDINKELFAQLNLTHPEEIWYTSFDGKRVQGWIQKPPNFDAIKKYPSILEIHGGPHS
ncbi:MAG: S9 family peptidase, partial [Acidobacteria bacterium]|nr:S9 family peptidase [Acidobacteriota bacterium]